jgi:hypothetical protein
MSQKAPFWILATLCVLSLRMSSQTPTKPPEPPSTLGLERGFDEFNTPDFKVKLVRASQTLAALEPNGAGGFDFTPADRLAMRSKDGFYHLGDIKFRLKMDDGTWREFSTATTRKPVIVLSAQAPDIARSDLSPTLPSDCPVQVIRTWTILGGRLVLHFEIINRTDKPIEIGELGIPMVFNNILTDRRLTESNEKCSFSDPYIGMDAGYIQVTRLKGVGPALVVVPDGKTPFEAYQLLREPSRPQQTAEGMFEWVIHSKALAEKDWGKAEPWNVPTSETLPPKGKREIGVKFLLSDKIQTIEKTLAENDRPVAVGIPGYVLPTDIDGKLFLKSTAKVKDFSVEPKGSMTVAPSYDRLPSLLPNMAGSKVDGSLAKLDRQARQPVVRWQAFSVRGTGWGRARLTINYTDGTQQTVQYYVTKPATSVVADLGRFLTTKQWFENDADPFKRGPSIITYDRETDKQVDQDNRVWIAGLGDEGGSGSWVAAAMKEFVQPDAGEIAKYERFIDAVLWGGIQYKDGPLKYGVRKSMLYYAPQDFPSFGYDKTANWTTWASWKKDQAESIGRGYNYPHVVAAYWSMYRNARNTENLVKNHPWDWYLDQAYETTKFMFGRNADGKRRVGYVELGLMEGTIFLELLKDLKREGWTEKAVEVEALMKERTDAWSKEAYPFGSEMAWDSTGQEEVYDWCKYFGYTDKALESLHSIIGYMPTLPHWGYNGNARRYWDFLYAAKLRRIERQIHHYGSGLNAIPVLDYYRSHPDDDYMLRVGYAGGNAALTNIDQEGFASAAFHTYPDTLKWDSYSGDYGMNFFGHAMNAATYLINSPDFGWQAFGGNIRVNGDTVIVTPLDSMRRRVYIAPFGLWLTLDAGTFSSIEIDKKTKAVRVSLSAATATVGVARLRIEQPANVPGIGKFQPQKEQKLERGAYVLTLEKGIKQIDLVGKK